MAACTTNFRIFCSIPPICEMLLARGLQSNSSWNAGTPCNGRSQMHECPVVSFVLMRFGAGGDMGDKLAKHWWGTTPPRKDGAHKLVDTLYWTHPPTRLRQINHVASRCVVCERPNNLAQMSCT